MRFAHPGYPACEGASPCFDVAAGQRDKSEGNPRPPLAAVAVGHDAGVAAVVAEDVPAVGKEPDVALPARRADDDAGLAVFPFGAPGRVELAHVGVRGFDPAAG